MSGSDTRHQAAAEAERAAGELEIAAEHLRTAAQHIRGGELPRYAAHLLASQGHLIGVRRVLDDLAVIHAHHSRPIRGEDA